MKHIADEDGYDMVDTETAVGKAIGCYTGSVMLVLFCLFVIVSVCWNEIFHQQSCRLKGTSTTEVVSLKADIGFHGMRQGIQPGIGTD